MAEKGCKCNQDMSNRNFELHHQTVLWEE